MDGGEPSHIPAEEGRAVNHLGIKNLSIALEALSRINTYETYNCMNDVRRLLEKEIAEAESPTTPPTPNPDDDIPF